MKYSTNSSRRVPDGAVSNKPIALRLLPAELDKVKQVAAREQRSMASVARLALLRGLADCERTKTLLVT